NLLALGERERVAACVPVRDFAAGGHILLATRHGEVKKTKLEAYAHIRAGGIQAMDLEEGDVVISGRRTDGIREVVLATGLGMIIRFSEEEVLSKSRGAGGVRGIEVEEGDEVIAADVVQEGSQILTVTERGFGKRTPLEEYRLTGRGGKGIIDIKTAGRNGAVVGMLQVRGGDDILLVTTKGKVIRIHADEVSSQGRNTMGPRPSRPPPPPRASATARRPTRRPGPPPSPPRPGRDRHAGHQADSRSARRRRHRAGRQGRRRADPRDPGARHRAPAPH